MLAEPRDISGRSATDFVPESGARSSCARAAGRSWSLSDRCGPEVAPAAGPHRRTCGWVRGWGVDFTRTFGRGTGSRSSMVITPGAPGSWRCRAGELVGGSGAHRPQVGHDSVSASTVERARRVRGRLVVTWSLVVVLALPVAASLASVVAYRTPVWWTTPGRLHWCGRDYRRSTQTVARGEIPEAALLPGRSYPVRDIGRLPSVAPSPPRSRRARTATWSHHRCPVR